MTNQNLFGSRSHVRDGPKSMSHDIIYFVDQLFSCLHCSMAAAPREKKEKYGRREHT